ncbi:hypothetical protein ONZ51_g12808 [Trametes cubensis]|uniref:Uncharacterized protein n=1 Tax=Trametes cubensis TaxID=1111947 RepID=A0AAD7TF49_9APHY|nr:hypothetical protein ONZ51_g12808 [Trametes cubensis]
MEAAVQRERMLTLRKSAEAKLRRRLQEKQEKIAREQQSRKRWVKRKREGLQVKLDQNLRKHESRASCSTAEHHIVLTNVSWQQQEGVKQLLRGVAQEAAQVATRRAQEVEDDAQWEQEQAARAAREEAQFEDILQEHRKRLAQLEAQRQQETEMLRRWEILQNQRERQERAEREQAEPGTRSRR